MLLELFSELSGSDEMSGSDASVVNAQAKVREMTRNTGLGNHLGYPRYYTCHLCLDDDIPENTVCVPGSTWLCWSPGEGSLSPKALPQALK